MSFERGRLGISAACHDWVSFRLPQCSIDLVEQVLDGEFLEFTVPMSFPRISSSPSMRSITKPSKAFSNT